MRISEDRSHLDTAELNCRLGSELDFDVVVVVVASRMGDAVVVRCCHALSSRATRSLELISTSSSRVSTLVMSTCPPKKHAHVSVRGLGLERVLETSQDDPKLLSAPVAVSCIERN